MYFSEISNKVYAYESDGTQKWVYTAAANVASSPVIDADGRIYFGSSGGVLYALKSDGTLKWTCTLAGVILASPAVGADGTIYIGSNNGNLYAVDSSGSLKWTAATTAAIESSAAVGSDGTIYVGSDDGYLYAFNSDGSQKWKFDAGAPADAVKSSPAVASDGTIYVGSDDDHLYAVKPDGRQKWKYDTTSDVASSPAVGSDGTIYVGSDSDYLYALNSDGSLKWSYDCGDDVMSSPAVGTDGTVYVGSNDDKLFAVSPSGSKKWEFATPLGDVTSSPAVAKDGTVYFGSWNDKFYAVSGDSKGLPWSMFHQNMRHTGRRETVEFGADPNQAAGVTVAVSAFIGAEKSASTLQASFSRLAGFTPVGEIFDFNATVNPAGSNATFFFETDQLNGTVAEFWLYKLKSGTAIPFYRYSNTTGNHSEGVWVVTDATGTRAENFNSVLSRGTTYRVYFTVMDNSTFDTNSSGGFINDPVTFGRFPASDSPDQPADVQACICSAAVKKTDSDSLVTTYGAAAAGFEPVSEMLNFNATISPAGGTAIFRFNSTRLSGPVGNLTLRKFFAGNLTSIDYGNYREDLSGNLSEGQWWITLRNNSRLAHDGILSRGTNYFINFVIKDNGRYDADSVSGNITDPAVLGTVDGGSGSSGGCMLNPAAGIGLEWLLVVCVPIVCVMRFRFRKKNM